MGALREVKLYKTDAVVLRAINNRDVDQLLVLFSQEYGKMRVMAYGARKTTSRKRGAVQPLCFSRFLLHQGREIDSVSQCEGLEAFPELLIELSRLCYASYVVELVENSTIEGEASESVFRLLLETLRQLGKNDAELVARAFALKLVTLAGYKPVLHSCASCHRSLIGREVGFSPAAGGILCMDCARNKPPDSFIRCNRGTVEILKLMLVWELSKLEQLKVDAGTRRELRTLLKAHIEYYLGYQCKTERFIEMLGGSSATLNNA